MARVGILGFGGGPSFIPLVRIEAVENFGWLTGDDFVQVLAMGNTLPGPIATKMAALIGYRVAGVLGAVAGLLGMVMPSAIAMIALYRLYLAFQGHPAVGGMLRAVRPVIIVLLTMMVFDLVPRALDVPVILIGVSSFLLIHTAGIHPAVVVVGALLLGALALR
ncbi:MAG TPA: chromate transporter [Clostridiales bacterium UBA8153]|nr:chromate transporter [Clostridiales bacterium UBA8153]